MIFHSPANKTHFHKKGCALVLFWKWGFLELGSGLLKGLARDRNMNFGINRFWNFEKTKVKFRSKTLKSCCCCCRCRLMMMMMMTMMTIKEVSLKFKPSLIYLISSKTPPKRNSFPSLPSLDLNFPLWKKRNKRILKSDINLFHMSCITVDLLKCVAYHKMTYRIYSNKRPTSNYRPPRLSAHPKSRKS